ncbi:hypothetical protein PT111_09030, partial [Erysipelothrix rhusiopathiae]|nr:hypothetical protein [Erysipelothrix rhusiopathiae]
FYRSLRISPWLFSYRNVFDYFIMFSKNYGSLAYQNILKFQYALQSHFGSIEELYEHQEDIICHSDCDDMADVARYYIEETGA